MGRDPALTDKHPSVIMNGGQYYYGHHPDPQYDYYLLESAHNGKDYWWFPKKEDLVAFLVNLPESVEADRRLKLLPEWHELSYEQSVFHHANRAALRAMAEEKLKAGTAQSFNMDLEGKHGPYEPQRIESRSPEPPMARVERQLRDYQAYRMGGLSEAGKLRLIEGEIDWTGVAAQDKEAVLAREVDFARITPEQVKFVYADIAFDKVEPADPAVAQALFDRSRDGREPQRIRDALVRETFRLNHELGYVGFRHQYVNDPGAVKEWPDPALREREVRKSWDEQHEGTFASYRQEFANDSVQALTAYRDHLRGILAGDLEGQIAYYNRVSERGRNIRHQDDGHREFEQASKALPSHGEPPESNQAPQQEDTVTQGQGHSRNLRDTTRNLVEAVLFDVWPRSGAIVDFGLRTQEHYEALYYPLRHGDITPEQVDAALGNGPKLTELVNDAPHNPHKGITFLTDWDSLRSKPEQPRHPSPSEIGNGPSPDGPDRGPAKRRGR
jgi:hypothetical protein